MAVMLALLLALVPGPAAAETAVRVTTDSLEYCQVLASRVATRPGSDHAASRALAEEGLRLCDAGQVRTGIARLRRALRASLPH